MTRLRYLISQHPIASGGFLIAVTLCLFFAIRFTVDVVYWNDPNHQRILPEEWMTPNMIAHSWHVDTRDLAVAIGITERPKGRPTLSDIAEMRGVDVQVVLDEVQVFLDQETGH